MKHKEYADGLRELANWIERHPEFPLPSTEISNYGLDQKEEAVAVMTAMLPCKKEYQDAIFIITKEFGPINYRFVFLRSSVCTPKVVGQKTLPSSYIPERTVDVVEWECHPLLG